MSEFSNDPRITAERAPAGAHATPKRAVMVYLIALFFTGEWLYFLGSLLYTLAYHFPPERRHAFLTSVAALPLAISELNGLLTVVASLLLLNMKKAGAGLMLASTLLLFGLGVLSWPALLQVYMRNHSDALLRSLLMGGSNLMLHVAATVYAFHLNRRGLLR